MCPWSPSPQPALHPPSPSRKWMLRDSVSCWKAATLSVWPGVANHTGPKALWVENHLGERGERMEPGFSKEWLQVWVLKPGQAQVLASGFYLGTSHPRALFSFLKYMSELSITS